MYDEKLVFVSISRKVTTMIHVRKTDDLFCYHSKELLIHSCHIYYTGFAFDKTNFNFLD